MKKRPILELTRVYENEATRLFAARDRGRTIHASGDIDASGDEVEAAVREFLRRKLPAKYYIGHGHVVDANLASSPQLDVIVANNSATPILFEGENGTQYFPYESVYLIGEVKTTYVRSKRYVSTFCETCRKLKEELRRAPTPKNYIGNGVSLGGGLSISVQEPYRNPVFSFMLFLESGDLSNEALLEEYAQNPDHYLPNIICFADGAFVTKFRIEQKGQNFHVGALDANCHRILQRDDLFWILSRLTDAQSNRGQALSILMMCIFDHLKSCVLLDPPIKDYLCSIIGQSPHNSELVDIRLAVEMAKAQGVPLDADIASFVEQKRKSEHEYQKRLTDEAKKREQGAPNKAIDGD